MPKIPDVIGGQPIEADWGNSSIRDRTVQRMDDVPDRDASIPTPEIGETVFVVDVGELHTWDGTQWMRYISSQGGTLDEPLMVNYPPFSGDMVVPRDYVDSNDADMVRLDGSRVLTGDLDMGGNSVLNAPGMLLDSYSLINAVITVTTTLTAAMTYSVPTIPGVPITIVADAFFRSNSMPSGASAYGILRISEQLSAACWLNPAESGTFVTATDLHQVTLTPAGTSVVVDFATQISAGSPSDFRGSLRVNTYRRV